VERQKLILHLDAVNWLPKVYVNGTQVGVNKGAYDPFSYDVTPYLNGAKNELIINVYSPEYNNDDPIIPANGRLQAQSRDNGRPVWFDKKPSTKQIGPLPYASADDSEKGHFCGTIVDSLKSPLRGNSY
jgi:hypothetical protein